MITVYQNTGTIEIPYVVKDSSGVPFDPSGSLPTVFIYNSAGTNIVNGALMTKYAGRVGVYTLVLPVAGYVPGNYMVIINYTEVDTFSDVDTLQVINMDYMGTGGSILATVTLMDISTGDPLNGRVCWLQASTVAGATQGAKKLSDDFGFVKFYVQPGTYYVYCEAYSTFVGTLVVTGVTPATFTINPLLTV